jgi:hypothetical protein
MGRASPSRSWKEEESKDVYGKRPSRARERLMGRIRTGAGEKDGERVVYLGIDPGEGGGLACLWVGNKGEQETTLSPMPRTERDVWDWIHEARGGDEGGLTPIYATIEKVGGYLKGSGGNIGSAMFTFGRSYGSLRMALTAARIPFEDTPPAVWQKRVGVPPVKGESKATHKNRLKARAQALFPQEKVTLATADALLLAEYTRRARRGAYKEG